MLIEFNSYIINAFPFDVLQLKYGETPSTYHTCECVCVYFICGMAHLCYVIVGKSSFAKLLAMWRGSEILKRLLQFLVVN